MEPVVESALQTPDGYWRVEVVRYRPGGRFYRIIHGTTVLHDRAVIAQVQRVLGDQMALLVPADDAADWSERLREATGSPAVAVEVPNERVAQALRDSIGPDGPAVHVRQV